MAVTPPSISDSVMSFKDLLEFLKILGSALSLVGALVIYAFKRMEKSQDKLEQALLDHIKSDETIHDDLFHQVRDSRSDLDKLLGEHHAIQIAKKDPKNERNRYTGSETEQGP